MSITTYNSLPYPWAAEVFDLIGFVPDEEWPEEFGLPSPTERNRLRGRAVLDTFETINWDHDDTDESIRRLKESLVPLGSNAVPAFLMEYRDEIPYWAMREVICRAHSGWNMNMGARPLINFEDWADLWRDCAYVTDDKPKPEGLITVWRGGPLEDGVWIDWSTDKEIARHFANMTRPGEVAAIWEVTIDPATILGRIDGRNEEEVIVDVDLIASDWEPIETWVVA